MTLSLVKSSDYITILKLGCKYGKVHKGIQCTYLCNSLVFLAIF